MGENNENTEFGKQSDHHCLNISTDQVPAYYNFFFLKKIRCKFSNLCELWGFHPACTKILHVRL